MKLAVRTQSQNLISLEDNIIGKDARVISSQNKKIFHDQKDKEKRPQITGKRTQCLGQCDRPVTSLQKIG